MRDISKQLMAPSETAAKRKQICVIQRWARMYFERPVLGPRILLSAIAAVSAAVVAQGVGSSNWYPVLAACLAFSTMHRHSTVPEGWLPTVVHYLEQYDPLNKVAYGRLYASSSTGTLSQHAFNEWLSDEWCSLHDSDAEWIAAQFETPSRPILL